MLVLCRMHKNYFKTMTKIRSNLVVRTHFDYYYCILFVFNSILFHLCIHPSETLDCCLQNNRKYDFVECLKWKSHTSTYIIHIHTSYTNIICIYENSETSISHIIELTDVRSSFFTETMEFSVLTSDTVLTNIQHSVLL